jgi:hypothetical protein
VGADSQKRHITTVHKHGPEITNYHNEGDEESVYFKLFDLAKAEHWAVRQQNIDKYVNKQGMTEEDTKEKVETKLQDSYIKSFMTKYSCLLMLINALITYGVELI